jgi:hypothetical protein
MTPDSFAIQMCDPGVKSSPLKVQVFQINVAHPMSVG